MYLHLINIYTLYIYIYIYIVSTPINEIIYIHLSAHQLMRTRISMLAA